jgi:hypothetical protein
MNDPHHSPSTSPPPVEPETPATTGNHQAHLKQPSERPGVKMYEKPERSGPSLMIMGLLLLVVLIIAALFLAQFIL